MLQIRYRHSTKGPLWLVDAKYTVGSAPGCDIYTVSGGEHIADVLVTKEGIAIAKISTADGVDVNDVPVKKAKRLVSGDIVKVGGIELELVDPKRQSKPATAVNQWHLKALNHALANREYPLLTSHTFGRAKECDICLGVAHLSRKHARLTVTAAGVELEDLGSSNGTFVNGKKVQRAVLRNGDELSFDTLKFQVVGPDVVGSDDSVESTTVRPALDATLLRDTHVDSLSGVKAAHTGSGSVKPHSGARKAVHLTESSEHSVSSVSVQSPTVVTSRGNGTLVLGALLLGVIGAVAYYFLSV